MRRFSSLRTVLYSFLARYMTGLQQFAEPLHLLQGGRVVDGLAYLLTLLDSGERLVRGHAGRLRLHLLRYFARHLFAAFTSEVLDRRLALLLLDLAKVEQPELRKSVHDVLSVLRLGRHRILQQTQVREIFQRNQGFQIPQLLYHIAG